MSSTEKTDLKSSLRKRDFPFCARDALSKSEELLSSTTAYDLSIQQVMKQSELTLELISEFVFNEVDRRGMRRKLTPMQELELMQVICDHMMFDGTGTEASRNSLFLSLFPVQATERKRFLVNLVSFAISTKNIAVLTAMGVLLQQVGCTSPYACSFATKLVLEFFMLVTVDSPTVVELPKIAPLFTANFLTAAAEAFLFAEGKHKIILPPIGLLEVVVNWIRDNPSLCIAPLMDKIQPTLLLGSILMPPVTPYAGLVKWCVLSNLDEPSPHKLYSTLESLLIESLMSCTSTPGLIHLNIILVQELVGIVNPLLNESLDSNCLKLAIESLTKIIRVTLLTGSLCGPRQELRRHLDMLPRNDLLDVFLQNISNIGP